MKRHITNIYNKLNVNNKMGLLRLLDDLNISYEDPGNRRDAAKGF